MKRLCLLVMAISLLSGCAESSALIKANSVSLRTDVFEELTNGVTAPQGDVDVRLTATFKTHKPGIYSAKDIHGTPDYKLLLNIDGQAVLLQGSLQKENNEPMKLVDPEAGDGIRYRFSKNLRLKAGIHKIVVALPDDEVAIAREITLNEGDRNSLVVEPIYSTKPGKRRPGMYSTTSFTEGIRSLRVMLNGKEV
ncbi:lipoprotein [Geobacter sulfurreducens]|uniref:Lipoprotein, putative n=2 Tax=Geobacter sulfurreducens TaxID=35554 RepID=Q74BA8_GEOSL|nr:lipoprotein, putative [Geobacter sulfurreducens PCA]UAC02859.1 lipoprotein [Geobacter sulfurreducens]